MRERIRSQLEFARAGQGGAVFVNVLLVSSALAPYILDRAPACSGVPADRDRAAKSLRSAAHRLSGV